MPTVNENRTVNYAANYYIKKKKIDMATIKFFIIGDLSDENKKIVTLKFKILKYGIYANK
jgi:hypothetical protein